MSASRIPLQTIKAITVHFLIRKKKGIMLKCEKLLTGLDSF